MRSTQSSRSSANQYIEGALLAQMAAQAARHESAARMDQHHPPVVHTARRFGLVPEVRDARRRTAADLAVQETDREAFAAAVSAFDAALPPDDRGKLSDAALVALEAFRDTYLTEAGQ